MNWITEIIGTPLGWIMWLLYSVIKNYGIVLLIFTILMKAAMFPLSIKQQKSTAKMAIFQPKIQEISKKYANNKEKQQEETMKLYQDHGYNPMSGCLPMLIPFPILFGLIDVIYRPLKHILHIDSATITKATEILKIITNNATTSKPELDILTMVQDPTTVGRFTSLGTDFINKVSHFDYTLFGIDLGVTPTWAWNWFLLVPILSGITAFLVSMISMKMNPATANQQGGGMMKGMMYMMPLMSVWIAFSVPAGVGIYWIISNILSGIQSIILFKLYSPDKYKQEYEAKMLAETEKKRSEREKRKQVKMIASDPAVPLDPEMQQKILSEKELSRKRLAEARKKEAEKYGETYVEVTDKDLM